MTKTLDLGCGDVPRNPFHADELFGVDVRDNLERTIRRADLVIEPIPFADASFDYVTAYDFLEHVPRIVYAPQRRHAFVELMNEVHRVLRPGGLFLSYTPSYPHGVAFRDPTHVNILTEETLPLYFDDRTRYASIYGFVGAFEVRHHQWRGPHLLTVLRKQPAAARPLPWAGTPAGRVSVFIPVHNGERHLAQTIGDVLAQTHRDFELICIDDASSDGSATILRHHAAIDPRVRVFSAPQRLGSAPKALNFALDHMTGDRFVYASQDDRFSPDWLERMVARAVETGADAVIPEVLLFHENDPSKDRRLRGVNGDLQARLSGAAACELSLDWSIPGNALWNAALVRTLRFEEFAVNADEYSVRRFFLACNEVVFSGGCFRYRQDNPEAVTRRFAPARLDWPLTQLRVAQLLQEQGVAPTRIDRERRSASESMAHLRRQWAAEPAGRWSAADEARARAAIERFEQQAALAHVFDAKRRKTPREHLARLALSVRKRLGLTTAAAPAA